MELNSLGELPPGQLDALYEACGSVSSEAFDTTTDDFWERHRTLNKHLEVAGLILVADVHDVVVGYSEFSRWEFPEGVCLYYHTAFHPSHQRQGLGPRLHARLIVRELIRRPHRTLYVAGRTRTPSVLARARKALGPDNVHPLPGQAVPPHVVRVARRLFDLRLGKRATQAEEQPTHLIDSELRVVGNALDLHRDQFPSSGDAEIDAHFEKLGAGEAYLTMQLISVAAWLKWATSKAFAR